MTDSEIKVEQRHRDDISKAIVDAWARRPGEPRGSVATDAVMAWLRLSGSGMAYVAHVVGCACDLVAGMPYTIGQPGHGQHNRLEQAVRELVDWQRGPEIEQRTREERGEPGHSRPPASEAGGLGENPSRHVGPASSPDRSAPAEGGDPHVPDYVRSRAQAVTGDRASDQHASPEAMKAADHWLNAYPPVGGELEVIHLGARRSLAALLESQRRDATRRALEMAAEYVTDAARLAQTEYLNAVLTAHAKAIRALAPAATEPEK